MADTLQQTDAARSTGRPWLPPAHARLWIDRRWLIVAFALTAAALAFFGWRALLNVALAGAGATVVHVALGQLTPRQLLARRVDTHAHALVMGLLLGLCLPPLAPWWFAGASGAGVGAVALVVGRAARLRMHPVALVMSVILLGGAVVPFAPINEHLRAGLVADSAPILRPDRMVLGDVRDAAADVSAPSEPWWRTGAEQSDADAVVRPVPAHHFAAHQKRYLAEPGIFREAMRAEEVPSLAAIVLGAAPGPVGATSVGLLLLLGLWLMHERMTRPGTAVAALIGAVAAVCVMPVSRGEAGSWTWALGALAAMSVPMMVLFVAHALLASLLPLIVLVLAGDGQPMSRAGRLVYGLLIGAGGVAAVWWLGRPEAAYLALVAAGLLARPLDGLRTEQFK